MYKKIVTAKGTEVNFNVPEELADKELEIIVEEKMAMLKTRAERLEEAMAYFDSISIATRDFKFNRDEANER